MQTQPPTKINADFAKFTEQYGSNFCPAPFEHVIIYGDEVMTCCKTKVPIGNLKDNTLKEIYEGPIIEQVRQQFLNNEKPTQCKNCWEEENVTDLPANVRVSVSKMSANTWTDDSIKKPRIKFLDVVWSNKCNFACMGCTPLLSSTINKLFKEQYNKLYGKPGEDYFVDYQDWETNVDHIKSYIEEYGNDLHYIHFQGGEPFLNDSLFDILDLMIEKEMFQTRILFHTNGSVSKTHKGKDLIKEYLAKWGVQAKVNFSLDGIGKRGEYIRYGYRQKTWERNFAKSLDSDIGTSIATRANVFNILHLEELGSYCNNKNTKFPVHRFGSLGHWANPESSLGLVKIHEPTRMKAIDSLKRMLETKDSPKPWRDKIKNYIKWLENDHMPKKWAVYKWANTLNDFDQARGTDFNQTFPELVEFKNYAFDWAQDYKGYKN
jgi:MoaA/NifB/PqqE/SkfB family radical SAM enzyme